jgi:hypothetical protein
MQTQRTIVGYARVKIFYIQYFIWVLLHVYTLCTYVCGPFRKDPYDNFVCTYSIMQTQPTIVGVKSSLCGPYNRIYILRTQVFFSSLRKGPYNYFVLTGRYTMGKV